MYNEFLLYGGLLVAIFWMLNFSSVESKGLKIESKAFGDGGEIPMDYTCDGNDLSPPLKFINVPEGTKSLALIVDDPDAPGGTWVHWVLWNIPPAMPGISEGENLFYGRGKNDFKTLVYGGPCPPSGTHRYFFKLYALDTMLDLEEGASKKQLEKRMKGHVIESAQLIGTYKRKR